MGRYKFFEAAPAKKVSGSIGCFDNPIGIQKKAICNDIDKTTYKHKKTKRFKMRYFVAGRQQGGNIIV
jgi:hypothetical protein